MDAYKGLTWVLRFKNADFHSIQSLWFGSRTTTVFPNFTTHYVFHVLDILKSLWVTYG